MLLLPLILFTPTVDPQALAVLVNADRRIRVIRSLSAICTHTLLVSRPGRVGYMRQVMKIRLRRPNLAQVESSLDITDQSGKRSKVPGFSVRTADGRTFWRAHPYQRECDSWPQTSAEDALKMVTPLSGFFDRDRGLPEQIARLREQEMLQSLLLAGNGSCQEVPCKIVRATYREAGSTNIVKLSWWIDPRGLIRRMVYDADHGLCHGADQLTDVKLDQPMSRSAFAYRPPSGYHASAHEELTQAALPIGAMAPDFTVKGLDGRSIRLADYRGKVVVLDFWATWCGNCIDGFPHLATLADGASGKDVVVLAVDIGDTEHVYRKWIYAHPQFASLTFAFDPNGLDGDGVAKLYKGAGLPTTYVIGRDGRIAASFNGYTNATDAAITIAVRETTTAGSGR